MIENDPLASEILGDVRADLRFMVDRLQGSELFDMAAHHFGWTGGQVGGKHIRPLLCLLCCASSGGLWRRAVPAATAIELIHNFSLIHDDIQDGSDFRRHRPTVWKIWGTAQAINAGDALFALARLSSYRLSEEGYRSPTVLNVQAMIDQTCLDLMRGQYLDLAFDTSRDGLTERYLEMIGLKTASLLGASAAIGAVCADSPEPRVRSFRSFGHHLGIAFQILDDVLGVWGDEHRTGKPVGYDLLTRKPSFPALHGLENEPSFADQWGNPNTSVESMLEVLDRAGSQEVAYRVAGEQTTLAFESLESASPEEPGATALRGLADRLLVRET